jgi:hypothetical protein
MSANATSSATPLRLDLGSGKHVRQGFDGVDFFTPHAKYQTNLMKFPWPWADNSVDELYSCHFLEHLPMLYVGPTGEYAHVPETPEHRDLLLRFMDECWRIMKPGAIFTVLVPGGRSNRGFQDPTHRRFFVAETFLYFNAEWRKRQDMDHYLGACNFAVEVQSCVTPQFAALPPKEQAERAEQQWNAIVDFEATLTAIKP